MTSTKQLVLVFTDQIGSDYTLRINDPKDALTEATVLQQMQAIINSNIIDSTNFNLETFKAAYIREVIITKY